MAIKTYVDGNSTLTVLDNGTTVIGASTGIQTVNVGSGVTGVTADANIERFNFAGNIADYKFVFVAGTGTQIQNAAGTVVATIPSLNQSTTLAFADGSTPLVQTGSSTFSVGNQTVPTTAAAITSATLGSTFSTTDKSPIAIVAPTLPTFSVASSTATTTEGNNATFTVTLSAAQGTATTVNYSLAGLGGAVLGTDTGAATVAGTGITSTANVDFCTRFNLCNSDCSCYFRYQSRSR
jgi:hypothetical protein